MVKPKQEAQPMAEQELSKLEQSKGKFTFKEFKNTLKAIDQLDEKERNTAIQRLAEVVKDNEFFSSHVAKIAADVEIGVSSDEARKLGKQRIEDELGISDEYVEHAGEEPEQFESIQGIPKDLPPIPEKRKTPDVITETVADRLPEVEAYAKPPEDPVEFKPVPPPKEKLPKAELNEIPRNDDFSIETKTVPYSHSYEETVPQAMAALEAICTAGEKDKDLAPIAVQAAVDYLMTTGVFRPGYEHRIITAPETLAKDTIEAFDGGSMMDNVVRTLNSNEELAKKHTLELASIVKTLAMEINADISKTGDPIKNRENMAGMINRDHKETSKKAIYALGLMERAIIDSSNIQRTPEGVVATVGGNKKALLEQAKEFTGNEIQPNKEWLKAVAVMKRGEQSRYGDEE